MEVRPFSEGLEDVLQVSHKCTYGVQRQESPQQNGCLLIEGNDVQALWQVGRVRIDDVLEVLREAFIQCVQIHPTVNDT